MKTDTLTLATVTPAQADAAVATIVRPRDGPCGPAAPARRGAPGPVRRGRARRAAQCAAEVRAVSAAPGVRRFDDLDAIEEYVETQLNEKGLEPTVALIDSRGTSTIAMRTAPGGDGYAFEFCMQRLADTGEHHCCWCSHDGGECPEFSGAWSPTFPVWIFVAEVTA